MKHNWPYGAGFVQFDMLIDQCFNLFNDQQIILSDLKLIDVREDIFNDNSIHN